jgi:hypothetical protein
VAVYAATFDLVFVVESSSFVGEANWTIMKRFAANVLNYLPIGSSQVRCVAFIVA